MKDQFEVVPKRGSLLKDGFLPAATYKQLVQPDLGEEKSVDDSAQHLDSGQHGGIPIYEREDV